MKEHISNWSNEVYTVKKIIVNTLHQDMYVVEGVAKPLLRNELLKIE